MWGSSRCIVATAALTFLAGCSQGLIYDTYTADPAVRPIDAPEIDGATPPGPINLDSYCFAEDVEAAKDDVPKCKNELTAYRKTVAASELELACLPGGSDEVTKPRVCADAGFLPYLTGEQKVGLPPTQAMVLRNRLQDLLIDRSNAICGRHLAAIVGDSSFTNAGASIAATALAGLSAAFGGTAAKTALATAAAIVTGGQAAVNGEIFLGYVAPAVTKKIAEGRLALLREIMGKRSTAVWGYTLENALVDVGRYHYACSFFVGLSDLVNGTELKREELTQAQITDAIAGLEKENGVLRDLLGKPGADRNSIELQLSLNNARLAQLRAMRLN
jgi:hypothetical protein